MNLTKDNEKKHPNECEYCSRKYVRKTDCTKHELLCAMLYKSRNTPRESAIVAEESSSTLTPRQVTTILHDLTLKYVKMEEKMESMQKLLVKQKKQINIINWLNENNTPSNTFNKLLSKPNVIPSLKDCISNQVSQEHIERLIQTNLIETIQSIFENNVSINNSSPIYCFEQKHNIFYIYVLQEGANTCIWVQMTKDDLVNMLNFIHSKLLREIIVWKKHNEYAIKNEDKMSNLYNKTMIKLMDVDLANDHVLGKIRTSLFNHLKKDLKNLIEYEFE